MQGVESRILSQSIRPSRTARASTYIFGAAIVLGSLSFVAAFGIAPPDETRPLQLQQVIRDISLPVPLRMTSDSPAQYWRDERVQPGDTVAGVLARLAVDDGDAANYLLRSRNVRSLYQLLPGKTVRAVVGEDGKLYRLSYLNRDGTQLNVERMPNGFVAGEELPAVESRYLYASGEIASSLFAASDAAGVPETIALQLADIFSSDVDFHRDLRRGDRFSLIYEMKYCDGDRVDGAQVVAAEFVSQGQTHRAVRFRDASGRDGYFSPDGRNMRKTFLRTPIEFSRMTSGFTRSRPHPLLGKSRAHKGIDYGAPIGTKVRATAAGSIAFVGQQGGYGNVIVLRHAGGYSTLYGHLSGFSRQARNGQRVEQGEVIGFVGSSGLATGPHLHYEFRVNGMQQDPLRLALPSGPSITQQQFSQFTRTTGPLASRLETLRNTSLAQLD
jgi:murein DD-endopeptidase MepM/ murein hydrolase activator NlpD